jgi:glycosyltransferase involved in cell wall biosynthesis
VSAVADGPHIKVLVYTNAPYKGGAEMTLAQMLSGLPERIEVTVAGVVPELVEWVAAHRPGTPVEVLPAISGRSDLGAMIAHARAFRRIRPDVIHFNLGTASASQWAMFIAVVKGRYRTLAVENSPVDAWSSTSQMLKKFNSPRLSAHVAVGDATARAVEEIAGLRRGSVETIYHGVPDVARDVPREPHDGPVILNIARHQEVKGVDVLLEAMTHLPSEVKLVQIGSGEEHDALVAQRDRLGLGDRVEFRDLPWDQRAADLIAGFDLFVLPSRNEGLPVTVMEAMLAGVGIVATDVGAIREELTDGRTGRIVPPEDPVALAKAVDELLGDPERRAELGRRAREDALSRFTVEATVARYCELYDRVVGTGR